MKIFDNNEGNKTAAISFEFYIPKNFILDINDKDYTIYSIGRIHVGDKAMTLALGNIITTTPTSVVEIDDLYMKFIYNKGDVFVNNTRVLKDSVYIEGFFGMVCAGQLPEIIPYEDWFTVIHRLVENNQHLEVNPKMFELHISNMFRGMKDTSKVYRLSDMKDPYISMNNREAVSQSSTFASNTFEDPISMLLINVTRKEVDEDFSPLEKYARL